MENSLQEAKRVEAELLKRLMKNKIPSEEVINALVPSQKEIWENEVVNRLIKEFRDGIPTKDAIKEIEEKYGKRVASQIIIKRLITNSNRERRIKACELLGELGIADDRVINALLETLKDEATNVRKAAVVALGKIARKNRIEKELLRQIFPRINSKSWRERAGICLTLGELGIVNDEVINALLKRSKDKEWEVREGSALALGKLGIANKKVIKVLIKLSRDDKPDVKEAAIWALGELGVPSRKVIKVLEKALKHPEIVVKVIARASLLKLERSKHVKISNPLS